VGCGAIGVLGVWCGLWGGLFLMGGSVSGRGVCGVGGLGGAVRRIVRAALRGGMAEDLVVEERDSQNGVVAAML